MILLNENSLKGEEECTCPQDEEEGQVEDALLPCHHDPAITAESVPARELLPLPGHFLSHHHHRHDWDPQSRRGCIITQGNRQRLRPAWKSCGWQLLLLELLGQASSDVQLLLLRKSTRKKDKIRKYTSILFPWRQKDEDVGEFHFQCARPLEGGVIKAFPKTTGQGGFLLSKPLCFQSNTDELTIKEPWNSQISVGGSPIILSGKSINREPERGRNLTRVTQQHS